MPQPDEVFATDAPARLDRLPFSRFHWMVVLALGVTWILDGLEVTLVGALSPAIAKGGPALRSEAASRKRDDETGPKGCLDKHGPGLPRKR